MQRDQETVEGLLLCLDKSIADADRRYQTLDAQYKDDDGNILSSEYEEYAKRKESIRKKLEAEAIEYQEKLDRLCRRIRRSQPALAELSEKNMNTRGIFPRNIALGKLHVQCQNLDFYVPKTFSFPFDRPMYICDDSKIVILHKIFLRLLFALPADKQEYYVFDPIGLGKTVSKFNSLFDVERLFPQKKVLSSAMELKEVLRDVCAYIKDLQSSVFNIKTDCQDWDSYNRRLYSQNKKRKMLPYKIFVFTSVPDGMDEECFTMFKTLLMHSRQCGILVLYSFPESILKMEQYKMNNMEIELKMCIEQSEKLHVVFEQEEENRYQRLHVSHVGEKFPKDAGLYRLLTYVKETAETVSAQGMSFDELMDQGSLFDSSSIDGLVVPIGCEVSGNSRIDLNIGDETAHYLIGGMTGSGKSNLLHNFIMSACCRYSPEELNIYLLDFKEGVEFNQYANPALRHAKLVATEADAEYGTSVLAHLVEVKEQRYEAFKKSSCKDIQGYRRKNPTELMPRILVFIDEFQVLFGNKDKAKTFSTLEMLAKQGRACGIHLIMATQSLKGIDNFSTLGSQFSGRIVLKCSVEESKSFLGGIMSNNEEAAELKVPFAIVNTSNGSVSGNRKFSVPKAEEGRIAEKIDRINQKCDSLHIHGNTKVFEGQRLPERPEKILYEDKQKLQLYLGEMMDYSAETFVLSLRPRVEENLLLCGHDDEMKKSLFKSVVLSAMESEACDEIVYIGEHLETLSFGQADKLISYLSLKEFIGDICENPYEKKRVVLLDNCNIKKQINYETSSYLSKDKKTEAVFFQDYLENANKNKSHILAFYEGTNQIKNCGIPKDFFNYRIGYSVNSDEKNFLINSSGMNNEIIGKNRAFFVDNLEVKAWFRPYAV